MIALFRAPGSKFVDKTGDIETARKHVQEVLQKLKREIFRKFESAMESKDNNAMAPLIQGNMHFRFVLNFIFADDSSCWITYRKNCVFKGQK